MLFAAVKANEQHASQIVLDDETSGCSLGGHGRRLPDLDVPCMGNPHRSGAQITTPGRSCALGHLRVAILGPVLTPRCDLSHRSPTVAFVTEMLRGRQIDRLGLVVIDPVRAFTDPTGRIGQIHAPDQFSVIVETVERLASFVATHSGPKVWVTSLYEPGQFSDGDLDHPLARLCADPASDDCVWDPQLVPPSDAAVVTKNSMDAGSSRTFIDATEAMVGTVDAMAVTGFWLSACVAATASSCAERLAGRVPVVVPLSLAATRLALYDPTHDHPADIDVTRRLQQLRSRGVVVCDSPEGWRRELARSDCAERQ